MTHRICPICMLPLPENVNGNRKYHIQCLPQKKRVNNTLRYSKISGIDNEALRLDRILKHHFVYSQGIKAIDKAILERDQFRWDFVTRITGNNPPIFWILEHGYSFSDNKKKIIIYNGKS